MLIDRVVNYLKGGGGIEEYPSDPKDPKNWTAIGESGLSAGSRFVRNDKYK